MHRQLQHLPALLLRRPAAHCLRHTSTAASEQPADLDFMPLELYPEKKVFKKRKARVQEVTEPRAQSMKTDQDWASVWPGPRSFQPSSVPLPVHQGVPAPNQPSPAKWGNAELMKIPNFLHLTPPAIERRCAVLKRFCSPWPEGVSYPAAFNTDFVRSEFVHTITPAHPWNDEPHTDTQVTDPDASHLPTHPRPPPTFTPKEALGLEAPLPQSRLADPGYFPCVETKHTYLYSSNSIRDDRARQTCLRVHLDDLELDPHAHHKLLRLVKGAYDRHTHTLSLSSDRCPYHRQNTDYSRYLLTVLRAEAQKVEPWEHEMSREDFHEYIYEGSPGETAVASLRGRQREAGQDGAAEEAEEGYRLATETLLNEGESDAALHSYGSSVLRLYGAAAEAAEEQDYSEESYQLPEANIRQLYSWRYQEGKKIVWIESGWTKYAPRCIDAPPY